MACEGGQAGRLTGIVADEIGEEVGGDLDIAVSQQRDGIVDDGAGHGVLEVEDDEFVAEHHEVVALEVAVHDGGGDGCDLGDEVVEGGVQPGA